MSKVTSSCILIVDDNVENQRVIAGHLIEHGHAPLFAGNGFHALDILDEEKPDLVLLDIMMPGIDGWETCRRIREDHSALELPVVMLSAKNSLNDIMRSFDVGANDYVTKPIIGRELIARVQNQLLVKHGVRERDALNDSLRELTENQQTFFSVLAHDLRNRLASSISLIDVVTHQVKLEPNYHELCQIAGQELARTHLFLDNLLTWGMREMRQADYQPITFRFDELSSKLHLFAEMHLARHQLELINEIPAKLDVYGDFDLVFAILRNFLDNAQKFSEPGSRIWLQSRDEPDFLCITVKDEGPGMSEEQVAQLRQNGPVIPQDTIERAGSGFGLQLSRSFAARHGGRIEIASQLGEGSAFTLCLPRKS
ncbi:MAG: response regulator [Verrucomicrobiota bacterium JB022]|nr:response regulator [Verrucomicrobiota bacterium JB022]